MPDRLAKRRPRTHGLESRAHEGDHMALRLWLRLLADTTYIETSIRRQLHNAYGITLARLDLMAQLERYPQGLRMGELSERMMVFGGNVTAITDQLEREGLVKRSADARDRRAWLLRLTARGRSTFAHMAARHEKWVIKIVASMALADQRRLYDLLGVLKTILRNKVAASAAPPATRRR